VGTASTTTETEVVTDFLRALEDFDLERALELLDPDIEYQNVPFPPARGLHAVEQQLGGMVRYFSGFEAINHNIAANGPVVLTERTDVIELGRVRMEFWVCGTFEVHDGRIRVWRDRFDFADMTLAMVRGLARAPFRR
jgi:limonene-1,2-epoxide hydrolase